jgi:hypothetical protein
VSCRRDEGVIEDIDDRVRKRGAVDVHEVRPGDRKGVTGENTGRGYSALRKPLIVQLLRFTVPVYAVPVAVTNEIFETS